MRRTSSGRNMFVHVIAANLLFGIKYKYTIIEFI